MAVAQSSPPYLGTLGSGSQSQSSKSNCSSSVKCLGKKHGIGMPNWSTPLRNIHQCKDRALYKKRHPIILVYEASYTVYSEPGERAPKLQDTEGPKPETPNPSTCKQAAGPLSGTR